MPEMMWGDARNKNAKCGVMPDKKLTSCIIVININFVWGDARYMYIKNELCQWSKHLQSSNYLTS